MSGDTCYEFRCEWRSTARGQGLHCGANLRLRAVTVIYDRVCRRGGELNKLSNCSPMTPTNNLERSFRRSILTKFGQGHPCPRVLELGKALAMDVIAANEQPEKMAESSG